MRFSPRFKLNKRGVIAATAVTLLLLAFAISAASAEPLEISDVSSSNITETTATITWTTDVPGNSTVNYGNSTILDLTVSDSVFTTSHTINLGNLTSGTLYYYEVVSTNETGNETKVDNNGGSYYTFTTDPYFPTISGVEVSNVAETSATITWTTDRLANSRVNYGETTPPGDFETDIDYVLNHTINLSNLDPYTLYYFEVVSTNQYGNTTTDNNGGTYYTFTTEQTAPQIWGVAATNITNNSATIVWTTDQPSTSTVFYGETQALGKTVPKAESVYQHSVVLPDLSSNTLYYYAVRSTNAEGKTTTDTNGGAYYTFNTVQSITLEGWGWFTNYSEVASATLEGYVEIVEREHAPLSYSMHAVGDLTLHLSDGSVETIPFDMYGSRVRSLFYLRQEETGKSATFTGTWMDTDDGQPYIMTTGMIALPNPEGQAFKTARLLSVILRTPEVEVPAKQADGFAENIEVVVAWITKFFDKLLDSLVGTGAGQILGDVLAKLMVLVAAVRDAVTPYIP
jgi:hypothetical protein